jgi:hypothetical protein
MHILLVVLHISLMVASLLLMSTAIALALRSVTKSVTIAKVGTATTIFGFIAGVILLLDKPILSECVILTSYLVSVIAVYAVGFGWGKATNARLLKEPTSS